jgi:drug/metabolite transporter (DMT)-like permease
VPSGKLLFVNSQGNRTNYKFCRSKVSFFEVGWLTRVSLPEMKEPTRILDHEPKQGPGNRDIPSTLFFRWGILIVLALIWGSSFILMKRGMWHAAPGPDGINVEHEVFTSSQVAALRMFIAFLFLFPFAFRYVRSDQWVHWKGFLGTGVLGNFIPAFLFTKAETGISSALTGMLNSLTPLFTLVLGVLLFKAKTRAINVVGVIIGFIGAIGLLAAGKQESWGDNVSYGTYVIIATVCYGLSVNIIKKWLGGVNSISITVWAFLFVGPPAAVYLFSTDFLHRLETIPWAWQSLGYVTILAVFGTALSVILFNVLIKRSSALFASSVTYLIPIVAMGWGVFEKEPVLLLHILSVCLILVGVYLVNRKSA